MPSFRGINTRLLSLRASEQRAKSAHQFIARPSAVHDSPHLRRIVSEKLHLVARWLRRLKHRAKICYDFLLCLLQLPVKLCLAQGNEFLRFVVDRHRLLSFIVNLVRLVTIIYTTLSRLAASRIACSSSNTCESNPATGFINTLWRFIHKKRNTKR